MWSGSSRRLTPVAACPSSSKHACAKRESSAGHPRASRDPAVTYPPPTHHALRGAKVAYFSMEMHIEDDIPTYSGGLGVLAGDTLRAAADLGIPLVGVTLVHRLGYVRQKLDAAGVQTEAP